jgi:hypothetical protein
MDITPRQALGIGDPNDVNCPACLTLRNGGDDAATTFKWLRAAGRSSAEIDHIAERHWRVIEEKKIFDISIDDKFLGMLFHGSGGALSKTWAITHDPRSMYSKNTWPEHAVGSKLRSEAHIGLWGSIDVYRSTLPLAYDDATVDMLISTLLAIVGFEGSEEDLELIATEKMLELQANAESTKEWAIAEAMRLTGLKDQSELDWKLTTAELVELLPPELLEQLYIIVPTSLTTDLTKFLKV